MKAYTSNLNKKLTAAYIHVLRCALKICAEEIRAMNKMKIGTSPEVRKAFESQKDGVHSVITSLCIVLREVRNSLKV